MSKTSELFNECVTATPQDVKQRVDMAFCISDATNTPLDLSIDRIHSEEEFNAACARIEELQELVRLGNLVADREDEHVILSA